MKCESSKLKPPVRRTEIAEQERAKLMPGGTVSAQANCNIRAYLAVVCQSAPGLLQLSDGFSRFTSSVKSHAKLTVTKCLVYTGKILE